MEDNMNVLIKQLTLPNDTDFDKKTKSKILLGCLSALCVGNMMLDNVYAFIPVYIEERNSQQLLENSEQTPISESQATMILSIFYIAQILMAPFNSTLKNILGSKNAILFGFVLTTTSTVGLGLMSYIQDNEMFFIAASGIRIIQGLGDCLLQFTGYAVITNVFSDQIMKYVGYVEIVVGLGLSLGLVIGSALYEYVQY